jgi:hypothetical protein
MILYFPMTLYSLITWNSQYKPDGQPSNGYLFSGVTALLRAEVKLCFSVRCLKFDPRVLQLNSHSAIITARSATAGHSAVQ